MTTHNHFTINRSTSMLLMVSLLLAISSACSVGAGIPTPTPSPMPTPTITPSPMPTSIPTPALVSHWESYGPEGGSVWGLAIDPTTPTTLYASVSHQAYRSMDGGESWKVMANLIDYQIYDLVIAPTTPVSFYVVIFGGGVLRSTDGGESWARMGENVSINGKLVVDPDTPTTLYARMDGDLFKSTDSGLTWNPAGTGLPTDITDPVIDPLLPTTLYILAGQDELFISMDSGSSWNKLSTVPHVDNLFRALAIAPTTPRTVYAMGPNGINKSTDGGKSWGDMQRLTVEVTDLVVDPDSPTTLYAVTDDNGIVKTTDGGLNWSAANTGLTNKGSNALVIDPLTPTTLYVGTGNGIFKSTDSGGTWTPINIGLIGTTVSGLVVDPMMPTTLYAGAEDSLFKSVDSGKSWHRLDTSGVDLLTTGMLYGVPAFDPLTSGMLYVAAGDVYQSRDGGESWIQINQTDTSFYGLVIDPMMPTTLYGSTGHMGLFKSTDGGGTWNWAGTGILSEASFSDLVIDPMTPTTLYATTNNGIGSVFKSTDGGESWHASDIGLDINTSVSDLAIDPLTPTTLYLATWQNGVYKSTDGGESWSASITGLIVEKFDYLVEAILSAPVPIHTLTIDPANPAILYAGTDDGLYKSVDGGQSWVSIGLTEITVFALAIDLSDPSTLYVGTAGHGVVIVRQEQ